jgi:DNA-binding beta-propeller fold protein YncE
VIAGVPRRRHLHQLWWLLLGFVAVSSTVRLAAAHSGSGISVDSRGRVYFNDTHRNVVWRIELSGQLTRVARDIHTNVLDVTADGSLQYPLDGYPPAPYYYVAYAADGMGYATVDNRVVRLLEDGGWELVAGDSVAGFRDGPAGEARFRRPQGIAVDSAGRIFVADLGNRRVRIIAPSGAVTTFTRVGWPWTPVGVALWQDRVYVLERFGNYFSGPPPVGFIADIVGHPRVRVISPDDNVVVASVYSARTRRVAWLVLALSITVLAIWLGRVLRYPSNTWIRRVTS